MLGMVISICILDFVCLRTTGRKNGWYGHHNSSGDGLVVRKNTCYTRHCILLDIGSHFKVAFLLITLFSSFD